MFLSGVSSLPPPRIDFLYEETLRICIYRFNFLVKQYRELYTPFLSLNYSITDIRSIYVIDYTESISFVLCMEYDFIST